jgi:tripartite-type tricarboxylate transporter receptor subunit TctC
MSFAKALWFVCGLAAAAGAAAQSFPSRPVKLVVPFPPGNSSDVSVRVVATHLAPALGQPIVVDNQSGAGGEIGLAQVARAAPDGHTLVIGSPGPLMIAPVVKSRLAYKPLADFAPVAAIASVAMVFVVRADSPIKDIASLIRAAKDRPGQLNYGSSGIGTTSHLFISRLTSMAAAPAMTHVPYKGGGGAAMTDLIGGRIDMVAQPAAVVLPQINSGALRPIGVTPGKRLAVLPQVPTIAEQGVRGYDIESWIVLLAPAGTAEPVLDRLNAETVKVLARPDVRRALAEQGFSDFPMPRARMREFLAQQAADWRKMVLDAGLQTE